MSVPAPARGLPEPADASIYERDQVSVPEQSDRTNAAPTFDELVASVYRPLSEEDQSRLDELLAQRRLTRDDFYDMLIRFVYQQRLYGVVKPGVNADMDLSFFIRAVMHHR